LKRCRLGLLGLGTVGTGLLRLLDRGGEGLCERTGARIEFVRALVRDTGKPRAVEASKLTLEPADIVESSDVDMVVEVMGGIEPARSLILRALAAGKPVVTANKAVLAAHGAEILAASQAAGKPVGFEASVCGGIPLLRAIATGLVAEEVEELVGILNGTSNFVLTRMYQDGLDLGAAVGMAQERGLAEADPTLDLDGSDAAHKLVILAEVAFHTAARFDQIEREGIAGITPTDVKVADEFGYVIKPVAVARKLPEGLDLRVHPALVPFTHALGPVSDEYNAVLVRGHATGETLFYGRGAGSLPTAAAVLSDIVELVRHPDWRIPWDPAKSRPVVRAPGKSRYYLRLPVLDRPGLIGKAGTILGEHDISITHAEARLAEGGEGTGNLMVLTHAAEEEAVERALGEIVGSAILAGDPLSLRILE
jgi:homoserine dehydrogenase